MLAPRTRLALPTAVRSPRLSTSSSPLALSAVAGPLHPPLTPGTLPAFWRTHILARHAERPALRCRTEPASPYGALASQAGSLAWSYAEFGAHVDALACGLVRLGVRKGDRVAVIMGNNSAYACLQWACARLGAVLVTINPAYRIHELLQTLRLVDVKHLFIVPRIRTSDYIAMLTDAIPGLADAKPGEIQAEALPALRNLVVFDDAFPAGPSTLVRSALDFRDVWVWDGAAQEERVVRETEETLDQDDVINMQYTSGTTGAPKAVCLTHHNLLNNGLMIGRCMALTPADVLCNVPPLFHCFGLVLGNLAAWTHGACVVYPAPVFSPPHVVDAVARERCTALHGVPTHFLGVLGEVDRRRLAGEEVDMSSLRTGIAAGSPVPIELMRRLIRELHLSELTIAYGMTETSPVSFQTTTHDPVEKRVETVGRVQPHVRAKIVDAAGAVVPVGTPGQLCVAGYLLQTEYWGDAAQTRAVMREEDGTRWMYTGDEGILDAEGYLRIVGRIKDIIIRGGENLFPVQIENVLHAHPDIVEASAIAVPDATYGEVVGAWIILKPSSKLTREDIRAHVAKSMNPQNAPGWVWILGEPETVDVDGQRVEELPKTASGKVQKHILRDWSKELARRGAGRVMLVSGMPGLLG